MKKELNFATEIIHDLKKIIFILIIVIIILILALVGSNLAWLKYESQFEEVTEQEQLIQDITNTNNTTFTQEMK